MCCTSEHIECVFFLEIKHDIRLVFFSTCLSFVKLTGKNIFERCKRFLPRYCTEQEWDPPLRLGLPSTTCGLNPRKLLPQLTFLWTDIFRAAWAWEVGNPMPRFTVGAWCCLPVYTNPQLDVTHRVQLLRKLFNAFSFCTTAYQHSHLSKTAG